ncbi:MAG TPA: S1 RNA-binding domain-containing protein [Sphingobacteriaceae bacterium]|nr:S1 RNA-binding domain-containing protein [Sphingobacteriaceae bacterium]
MSIAVGDIVEGTVTGITRFGAFVELPNGQTGLVHISEVADTYVEDVNDHYKVSDKVKVKVLSMEDDGRKIGLSIRQAQPGYDPNRSRRRGGRGGGRRDSSFEDLLSRFMKESEMKLAELRRGERTRRGRKS